MSEASKLYHLNAEKIVKMRQRIDELEDFVCEELGEIKKSSDKEVVEAIAKGRKDCQKIIFFAAVISIVIFATGVFTKDGFAFSKDKMIAVLDHASNVVIGSSISTVFIYFFPRTR